MKGLQALRNFNGGALVVGFDNGTLRPDLANYPGDAAAVFHTDTIQGVVSHYSSQPFDIEVHLPVLDGRVYPVIAAPAGVQVPVAAKRDLVDEQGSHLISCNDVYFRTLNSNNQVSSAKIPYKDWPELMGICFDNREADIGRFLRRHLGDIKPGQLGELLGAVAGTVERDPTMEEQLLSLLTDGRDHFFQAIAGRLTKFRGYGTFEVALVIAGKVPRHSYDQEFLRLLSASNPRLTGWPIWFDSSGFLDKESHPYVLDKGWEALVISGEDRTRSSHLDFMRLEPVGRFYLLRSYA